MLDLWHTLLLILRSCGRYTRRASLDTSSPSKTFPALAQTIATFIFRKLIIECLSSRSHKRPSRFSTSRQSFHSRFGKKALKPHQRDETRRDIGDERPSEGRAPSLITEIPRSRIPSKLSSARRSPAAPQTAERNHLLIASKPCNSFSRSPACILACISCGLGSS